MKKISIDIPSQLVYQTTINRTNKITEMPEYQGAIAGANPANGTDGIPLNFA